MDNKFENIFPLSMLILTAAGDPALRFNVFEPEDTDLTENTLTLKEGTTLSVACTYLYPNHRMLEHAKDKPIWKKIGDTNFHSVFVPLTIKRLNRTDAGNYTCMFNNYSRTLTLRVLFPVNQATIDGPYKVKKDSSFNLTCLADSNPPPKYWWTMDPYPDAPKISSDSILTINSADRDDYWLYCFASSTTMPTVECPETTTVSQMRHVITAPSQERAVITELPDQYTVYAGSMIDIPCYVTGTPFPDVWWTKRSDVRFRRNGSRLIEKNVQLNFTDTYICNARNTITLADEIKHAFDNSKEIFVQVDEIPQQDNTWAIIAAIAGWVLAVAIVLVQILFRIRRNIRTSCVVYGEEKEAPMELSTITRYGDAMRYDRMDGNNQRTKLTVACQTVEISNNDHRSAEQTARKQHFMATQDSGAFGSYEKF